MSFIEYPAFPHLRATFPQPRAPDYRKKRVEIRPTSSDNAGYLPEVPMT